MSCRGIVGDEALSTAVGTIKRPEQRVIPARRGVLSSRRGWVLEGHRYVIWGMGRNPGGLLESQAEAWGLPIYALFDIVNRQLAANDVRLFALGGGNDLFEVFMSTAQAEKARRALPRKTD